VRRAVVFGATLTLTCGGEVARPNVAHGVGPDASVVSPRDAAPAADAGDALSVDERAVAPGMREVRRVDVDVAKTASVSVPTSAQVDTCTRVAVRTLGKVRARLIGPAGVLAEGLTLAERGPVCVRKGEALTVELSADEPARARVVIWVSP
jgi:hypothetical protein